MVTEYGIPPCFWDKTISFQDESGWSFIRLCNVHVPAYLLWATKLRLFPLVHLQHGVMLMCAMTHLNFTSKISLVLTDKSLAGTWPKTCKQESVNINVLQEKVKYGFRTSGSWIGCLCTTVLWRVLLCLLTCVTATVTGLAVKACWGDLNVLVKYKNGIFLKIISLVKCWFRRCSWRQDPL